MILSRLVWARANLNADIVASVPELTKRIISIFGMKSMMLFAKSISSGLGAP